MSKWSSSVEDRFWQKVIVGDPEECWEWTGALAHGGYGACWNGERQVPAHCFVYELMVGPIPKGMQIDHQCHTSECEMAYGCPHRRCVNYRHLVVSTPFENVSRGNTIIARAIATTHCPQGHPLSGENLYVDPRGYRGCRACRREQSRKYQRAVKACR